MHLFTALGNRAPRLRCRACISPKMQTDPLLGYLLPLTSHAWSLNLENGTGSGATLHKTRSTK